MNAPIPERQALRRTQAVKIPENLLARAAEIEKRVASNKDQAAATPQQLFLPGLREHMHAIPNYLSRCGVFAPIQEGRRQYHDGTIFLQTETVTLKGWGKQLTEEHADIWLHALYLGSKGRLGEPLIISHAEFLRGLGRAEGGSAYRWLKEGIMALSTFTIAVDARTKAGEPKYSIGNQPGSRVMQMLGGFDYNDGAYHLIIDPRWKLMFTNQEFGFLDWNKRLQIGQHQNLAKSLQRLICASADEVQRYNLKFLKDRAQYRSPMRKFREALDGALERLEALNIIADHRIELSTKRKEQATWRKL